MPSPFKAENLNEPEFRWGKKRGVGGRNKDVQFYESFTYDGVDYNLYDCVYMHKEGGYAPYIGKLVKIWESGDKSKRIKIQWFFRPQEISYYLRDVEWLENELFLASGFGNGLVNLNDMEAIAGKCNVICISKDCRNPQPSVKELQMADYVFYRTFDVKNYTISGHMDDSVGGLEVKFVFNKKESDRTRGFGNIVSKVEVGGRNAVAANGTLNLSLENSPQQLVNVEPDESCHRMLKKEYTAVKQVQVEQESSIGEKKCEALKKEPATTCKYSTVHVNSNLDKKFIGSTERSITSGHENVGFKVGGEKGGVQDTKASFNTDQVEDRVNSARTQQLHTFEASSSKVKGPNGLTVLEKNAAQLVPGAISSNAKHNSEVVTNSCGLGKGVKLAEKSSALDEKLSKASSVAMTNNASNKTAKSLTTQILPNATGKSGRQPDLEGPQTEKLDKTSSGLVKRQSKRSADLFKEKPKPGGGSGHEIKDKPLAIDSCNMGEGPTKKAKLDDSIFTSEDNNKLTITKLKKDGASLKCPPSRITVNGENSKSRIDKGPSKQYHNGKMEILSNDALSDVTITKSKGNDKKVEGQTFEVTRRPLSGKSNWMKLPWEERMKTAHGQGRLVLLQNLDPKCTSGEVEDIMWHIFEEYCTAKMVQHTASSNPHSGQAFVIFRTRETANRVVRKLDDGCLMLPNHRPLVGCAGVFAKSEKQRNFFGHLAIDKARMQIQRELKEAVSTSHYSQNNTIEYEMAMAWCWQQSKSDKCWEKLYEQQRKQIIGLISDLKSK